VVRLHNIILSLRLKIYRPFTNAPNTVGGSGSVAASVASGPTSGGGGCPQRSG